MLPDFLIIGTQKSATTFFADCLREHPEVWMPPIETPFFDDPFYAPEKIGELAALFEGVTARRKGIKRPEYLGYPACPARIHRHLPDAQLIAVLRHPVERAISAYHWYMMVGCIPLRPVDAGLRAILAGEYRAAYPKAWEILDYGFYHRHLTRYLEAFDRDQMLVLRHETVSRDNWGALQQVYDFLGVERTFVPRALDRRPMSAIYALPRIRWLRWRNPWIHRYITDEAGYQGVLVRRTPWAWFVRVAGYAVDRLLLSRLFDNTRPRLSAGLRAELLALYHNDVSALAELLGWDLTAWYH